MFGYKVMKRIVINCPCTFYVVTLLLLLSRCLFLSLFSPHLEIATKLCIDKVCLGNLLFQVDKQNISLISLRFNYEHHNNHLIISIVIEEEY